MIIADPKKELYEKHAKQLESEGYKISTLDLREPYSSARWNPMQVLIRRIRQVRELQNDMKEKDGKYYACGEVFISHVDARTRVQELKDEIFENAMDLVYTLCPVQNKDQPTWEEGARNLIFGLVLAFCEDCIAGKMDEKQLRLFNVYHNITKYCSEDTTALKQYLLEGREEFSKVRGLVNTVLITSDKTLTSYLSEVNSYMQQLADDGILSMTSENDNDIANMDESPNALFVIVPDERFTRHRFVTLFLTQTYKELVEKANTNLRKKETDTAILKRRAYFILDEFGNLPKMENIEGMVTVGRSRVSGICSYCSHSVSLTPSTARTSAILSRRTVTLKSSSVRTIPTRAENFPSFAVRRKSRTSRSIRARKTLRPRTRARAINRSLRWVCSNG